MSIDDVLAPATVGPLSAGDLLDHRRLPVRFDAFGVVPDEDKAVTLHAVVRVDLGDVRN